MTDWTGPNTLQTNQTDRGKEVESCGFGFSLRKSAFSCLLIEFANEIVLLLVPLSGSACMLQVCRTGCLNLRLGRKTRR